MIIETIE